ncbi:hypothetical protein QKQ66_gp048 [Dione juno nucleopolyhedrovirus]|uniref:Uncharacterized protein n=1 Tax=Dione juno nucleopolyhedrovirus TaxID=2594175 RepID=A0AAE6LCK3_9ABAC|nr:hypothetical protein QKQ66_gp048 [Dione juno nucleopolyhedrovirus]QDL57029.1 hypothetical protein DijuNPV-ORF-48 [Dione juno nucleopolyhedrovirus]
MLLTASVLYVSYKVNLNLHNCIVVEQLQCYNRDSLALVLTSDAATQLVCTIGEAFEKTQIQVLESVEFSVETVRSLRLKMHHIVRQYNENFAD